MDFVTNEKLTIVGAAGMIGSNMAQTALMMRLTPNICLYDPYGSALEGVAEELYHCAFEGANITWTTDIREALTESVVADIRANNAYWAQFEGPVSTAWDRVYDSFLKSTGESRGVQSYGTVVDLLVVYYKDAAFTHYVDKAIDMKQVVNTNKALVHLDKFGDKLLVTATIDNLLKGASGQAVQNMNLMFGLDETSGLRLKPSAF